MTNEEKQLLLKDLCARLPYGVITKNCTKNSDVPAHLLPHVNGIKLLIAEYDLKPYLRPMESMTDEEREEWFKQSHVEYDCEFHTEPTLSLSNCHLSTDWLIANHFDYRGLIPMGLALPAPEGMYNKMEE